MTTTDASIEDLVLRYPYFKRTLLPDPEPRARYYTIMSADDHVLESTETFRGRVPARYAESAPRIAERDGVHVWVIEGQHEPITASNAQVCWPPDQRSTGPVRLDDMRPGVWDVNARVTDMDLDGVWASVLFPSINFGFAGQRFSRYRDPNAGLAAMRAYNDWIIEEIVGAHPTRFVASQLTWLPDVDVAAEEVRRNADRGFTAVIFTENPEKLGYPSLHTGYWDPFFRACEETDTVVNVHVGSSSHVIKPSSDSPFETVVYSITVNPILASFDWIFSKIPLRFPCLKVALSEGGIDWVPMIISRLQSAAEQHALEGWTGELTPADVFMRNFWYSALFDTAAYEFLGRLCPDHVMLETDYPHGDATFPNSQEHFRSRIESLDPSLIEKFTFKNASNLYRHPLPVHWHPLDQAS